MAGPRGKPSWLLEGMDSETCYNLEMRIIAYNTRTNWFSFSMVVDSDTSNFKDLLEEIGNKYPCSYGDLVKLFYYSTDTKSNIEVKCDQDLMEMFANNVSRKTCYMSIAYYAPGLEPPPIPAIPDKSMWPKANHGFFMHPPLLKSTAGRRRQNRYKASTEGGTSTKGKHECPICHDYGHHWYTCKEGDPADIAAMLAERGPPKKRQKKTVPASTETSIVPASNPVTVRMVFPEVPITTSSDGNKKRSKSSSTGKKRSSSQGTTVRKSKSTTPSTASVRGSGTGSNQLEVFPLASELPSVGIQDVGSSGEKISKLPVKKKATLKKVLQPQGSPAMNTRSKVPSSPDSPAMGTRSKRKLNISG